MKMTFIKVSPTVFWGWIVSAGILSVWVWLAFHCFQWRASLKRTQHVSWKVSHWHHLFLTINCWGVTRTAALQDPPLHTQGQSHCSSYSTVCRKIICIVDEHQFTDWKILKLQCVTYLCVAVSCWDGWDRSCRVKSIEGVLNRFISCVFSSQRVTSCPLKEAKTTTPPTFIH